MSSVSDDWPSGIAFCCCLKHEFGPLAHSGHQNFRQLKFSEKKPTYSGILLYLGLQVSIRLSHRLISGFRCKLHRHKLNFGVELPGIWR